jgi:hypothetical protein
MTIRCVQITVLTIRRHVREKPIVKKKPSDHALPGQLSLPFGEVSPPDSKNHL